MITKLTSLTPAQHAAMGPHAQAWIARALEARPADRVVAERGIRAHYRLARLPEPRRIVWTTSPLAAAVAGPAAARLLGSAAVRDAVGAAVDAAAGGAVGNAVRRAVDGAVGGAVYAAVYDAVGNAVGDAVGGAVHDAVHTAVRGVVRDAVDVAVEGVVRDAVDVAVEGAVYAAVYDAVGNAVGDAAGSAVHTAANGAVRDAVDRAVRRAVDAAVDAAVGGAVRRAVCDAVRGAVGDAVGDAVGNAVYDAVDDAVRGWHLYCGGAAWAAWPAAWGTFYRDHCGLDPAPEALQAAEDVTECWWWWPHREYVIVSDRPTRLRRDAEGRLHSEDGPAIQWPDGWGVYAWHGTRVPAEWIMQRGTIDPRLALTHPQIEERRCLAEILGWERVLSQLDPHVIDTDPDPQIGTLLEVHLPDSGRERFLRVLCGTGRTFALPVPPDVGTALAANAWTYGLPAHEYRPEVRT